MNKSLFILGRQPAIGLAELESRGDQLNIEVFGSFGAVSNQDVDSDYITNLGGTMKIAKIIDSLPELEWSEIENQTIKSVLDDILDLPEGKINLGISCYGIRVDERAVGRLSLSVKKAVKSNGRSIRVVPNQSSDLSTAQVLHNKLTGKTGMEIIIANGNHQTVIAKTIAIQDINGYADRDQVRPKRDAKVGMLPPKLAQIMINLAQPKADSIIIDPFCGTGVVLQEALLMGHSVYGTDLDERMIEYSKINLEWLNDNFKDLPDWEVEQGDAKSHIWNIPEGCVASETYLGRPFFNPPSDYELQTQINEVTDLLTEFLANLHKQLKANTRLCLAVPAWQTSRGLKTLPMLDHLEKIGYNHMSFKTVNINDLIYHRPQQVVARQLLVLNRK